MRYKNLKACRLHILFWRFRAVPRAAVLLSLSAMLGIYAGSQSSAGLPSYYARKSIQTAGKPPASHLADGDGRKLFESICAGCHGLDGRGAEKGPNIATSRKTVQRSDADILAILKNGMPAGGMPAFLSLGPAKLKALAAQLRILQGRDRQLSLSGDPAKGKVLFFKNGSCAACHAINGAGGFLGSDLSIYGAVTYPDEMRDDIRNHARLPRAQALAVSTRDGRTLTGYARNEDNFSLQLQTLDGNFHFLDKSELLHIEQPPPATAENHEQSLTEQDLDALIGYLVNVAQSSKDAAKLQPHSKHHDEEEDN